MFLLSPSHLTEKFQLRLESPAMSWAGLSGTWQPRVLRGEAWGAVASTSVGARVFLDDPSFHSPLGASSFWPWGVFTCRQSRLLGSQPRAAAPVFWVLGLPPSFLKPPKFILALEAWLHFLLLEHRPMSWGSGCCLPWELSASTGPSAPSLRQHGPGRLCGLVDFGHYLPSPCCPPRSPRLRARAVLVLACSLL